MKIIKFLNKVLTIYLISAMVFAQNTILLNFENADIKSIVELMSKETKRNFLLDPRVRRQNITLIAEKPVTKDEAYSIFISILRVYGYGVIESDNITKIVPISEIRQNETDVKDISEYKLKGDDISTAIISLKNIKAEQIAGILRPMIPSFGQVIAHGNSNSLIVLAPKSSLNKIVKIIKALEKKISNDIQLVQLKNSNTTDIVAIMTKIEKKAIAKTNGLLIVEDKNSNQIVLSGGTKEDRDRTETNIKKLDKSRRDSGKTQVIYLNYAKAKELATTLKDVVKTSDKNSKNKEVIITADENTNSIIVQAPISAMQEIKKTIAKLDIRKAQVLVQAIIVEIADNIAAEIGIRWLLNTNNAIGLIDFTGSANLINLIAGNGGSPNPAAIGSGSSIVVGDSLDNNKGWGALLKALRSNSEVNILSTPSVVALDNENAKIIVGQEIPFITGQSTQNSGNPFTTIQRKEVGLKLDITPQVNAGNTIQLKIEQEVSSLQTAARLATGASDIITSKRSISTSVIIDDNEILILGGLTTKQTEEGEENIPVLSSLPLIGNLFKSRRNQVDKRTLMIFVKADIIRNKKSSSLLSNKKYSQIYKKTQNRGPLSLISGDTSLDLSNIKKVLAQEVEKINKEYEKIITEDK